MSKSPKWLLARRAVQAAIIAAFVSGPLAGMWIAKGNMASSLTFGILPLTDPLVLAQSLLAGHWPGRDAWIGAVLVLAAYLLVGGRTYCGWVCPINPITDLAAWLRNRLGLRDRPGLPRSTRLWVLAGVLLAAALSGTILWEGINPVTLVSRALVGGSVLAGCGAALAVFALDLGVIAGGWCGRLCPVGAFYNLLGRVSPLRVSAAGRASCDDCMECFTVCPERQSLIPALRGETPLVPSGDCTNCGRCIDVCHQDVFRFAFRFGRSRRNLEGE